MFAADLLHDRLSLVEVFADLVAPDRCHNLRVVLLECDANVFLKHAHDLLGESHGELIVECVVEARRIEDGVKVK